MAIYKRGKTYWFEFVFQGERVRKSAQTSNRRAAEQIEAAFKVKLAKGEVDLHVEKKYIPTFGAAITEFLHWSKTEHAAKPATTRRYETSSKALLSFFGNTLLDRISPDEVEKFKQWRIKQKKQPPNRKLKKNSKATTKETIKPSTVNRELACLKIVFNYFIKQDAIAKNPVSRVKFLQENNEIFAVLNQDDERLYLMASSQPLQDVATMMLETGARPEEIYRLQKQDVNLDGGFWQIPDGKTKAARRRIPLTARAISVLQSRIANTKGEYLFIGGRSGDEDKPIVKLNNAHNGAIKRAGLKKFRLYDLRHTFASRMAMAGVDLVTLAALLGHSRVQMVMRYAHPIEEHKFEAVRRLENFNAAKRKVG
jgi:integrase